MLIEEASAPEHERHARDRGSEQPDIEMGEGPDEKDGRKPDGGRREAEPRVGSVHRHRDQHIGDHHGRERERAVRADIDAPLDTGGIERHEQSGQNPDRLRSRHLHGQQGGHVDGGHAKEDVHQAGEGEQFQPIGDTRQRREQIGEQRALEIEHVRWENRNPQEPGALYRQQRGRLIDLRLQERGSIDP